MSDDHSDAPAADPPAEGRHVALPGNKEGLEATLLDCTRALDIAESKLIERTAELKVTRQALAERREAANTLNSQLIETRATLIERTSELERVVNPSAQMDEPEAAPLPKPEPGRQSDHVPLATFRNSAAAAFTEFFDMARQTERWGRLALVDTQLRYRRTTLGPAWLTLSTAILVLSVGLTYGTILGQSARQYIPYFMIGYIFWTFISATIIEGCSVFLAAGGVIKSVPAPLSLHVFRMMARQFIVLAHNAVLIVLGWLLLQWSVGWNVALIVPGFALVVATTLGVVLLLGTLCTRFRDLQQLVTALLQLLFLLTPIVWRPDSLRGANHILTYNPLYYLLEVVRGPLLGHSPSWAVWGGACLTAAVSLLTGLAVYGRYRHRIAVWL
jgi:ABC-type polysaccharide/polyol phosphate export permease